MWYAAGFGLSSRPNTTPLLSTNGTLLKEKNAINERWRKHSNILLNRSSTVSNEALDQIPQRPTIDSLDFPPSMEEVQKAIKQISSGKAPDKDGIPAEIYKAAGPVTLNAFHSLLCSIWEEEDIPQEFRDATIISLYKNKGSKSDCGNYWGISLLSIAGKILVCIILNRLIFTISEHNLPEAQCGFRQGRSTTDMTFAVQQVQEKCREQNMDLYALFVDLTKAFHTVDRAALWKVLQKLGCPRKFVTLIRLFHDSMTGLVLSGGEASEPFEITNCVKQGCVLAPVLFNLFFACVLSHAVKDIEDGVYIRNRLVGSLFDPRRLNAKTQSIEKLILEALFTDDCALMAHSESTLQLTVDKFAEASRLFGLTISLGKTEVLLQPSPLATDHRPSISIEGTELRTVEEFKYLGSVISSDSSLDKEINAMICKASQALGRLRARVLNQHNIQQSTKLRVYKTVVLTSLLYGCETWTLYRRHIKLLEHFHMRSLRLIIGIKWQDMITNLEVLDRAETTSIEAMILKAQLRWKGHIIRMDSDGIPKQLPLRSARWLYNSQLKKLPPGIFSNNTQLERLCNQLDRDIHAIRVCLGSLCHGNSGREASVENASSVKVTGCVEAFCAM
ncbi:RNA-directed DNA polymerase from mobile element jockey [Stylophora pistillata]|uniref:RNA-directed DNA polymerase from mobile element jockey n=1 Tax=Stylophora pistillata TaxID=50429 RepID=A0A2B4R5K0_STYPI|nr:RNA-directed DNA polymerase from mobile element jockey [Stylophora pistillata]